ncbi:Serine/threonine-protein kinase Stk11 [Malassezia pachydermatis]
MGAVSQQERPRMVPPPPSSVAAGNSSFTPVHATSAAPSATPSSHTFPTAANSTHIEFSRFTDADKHAFFGLLDEYFLKRSGGTMCLDDPFDDTSMILVGHGLCSVVYKAPWPLSSALILEDGGVPHWICIKKVDLDAQNQPHDVERELRLLQRLRHKRLAQLLAAFTDAPDDFTTLSHLVMPLYPYKLTDILNDPILVPSAETLLASSTARSPWHALFDGQTFSSFVSSTLVQLADVVAYLHSEQVAHRDIKPSNIMFGTDGTLKLIDLGVAWERGQYEVPPFGLHPTEGSSDCARISDVGSGAFRAPELLFAPQRGYNAFQADIWSLGMVMASFFSSLQEVCEEDDLPRNDFTSWERSLFPDRPSHDELRRWRPIKYERDTLFDSSNGDIALACDFFKVLGLPDNLSAWPEAAHFQPPLEQFPFVHHAATETIWSRLPYWASLAEIDGSAAGQALYRVVEQCLPSILQLSSSQRPSAHQVVEVLTSS